MRKKVIASLGTLLVGMGMLLSPNVEASTPNIDSSYWNKPHHVRLTKSIKVEKFKLVTPAYKSKVVKTYHVKAGKKIYLSSNAQGWVLIHGKKLPSHAKYAYQINREGYKWFKIIDK